MVLFSAIVLPQLNENVFLQIQIQDNAVTWIDSLNVLFFTVKPTPFCNLFQIFIWA